MSTALCKEDQWELKCKGCGRTLTVGTMCHECYTKRRDEITPGVDEAMTRDYDKRLREGFRLLRND